MLRSALLAVALACAVALTACGAEEDPSPLLTPAVVPAAGPVLVERSDGRLGPATTVRPDTPLDELAPAGTMDLRERRAGRRRDGVNAGAHCPGIDLAPAADTLAAMAESTLCLLNAERAVAGLPPLTLNDKLTAASAAYAQDLVAGQYFSHTGRDGSTIRTRLDGAGYLVANADWAIGENLAWGTGGLATPGSIMQAWMNSEGHRHNILSPHYREIGIGIVPGNPAQPDGAGATYATAFGALDFFEEESEAAPAPKPRSRPAKKAGRHRKGGKRQRARVARNERRHRKGKRRGPLARIAI